MANFQNKLNPDRYLKRRGYGYQYYRRVPLDVAPSDSRKNFVRLSLHTADLAEARIKRDELEAADDTYWNSIRQGGGATQAAKDLHKSAIQRAEALGLEYKEFQSIRSMGVDAAALRTLRLANINESDPIVDATLGLIPAPSISIKDAADIYFNEITPHTIVYKSPKQREHWRNVKERAVDSFIKVVSNKPIGDITRDDAQSFYRHWLNMVAPKVGEPTHSASSGNRHVGNMRVIYDAYYKHIGDADRANPFANLSFTDRKERSRPPFSVPWILKNIMTRKALAGLNSDARGIVLALIETGARPSEICNLTADQIILDAEVPHIDIRPRFSRADPREIKTKSSIRTIPLIGISLAAFKANPNGFPRYKDKEDTLSASLNKYFKENKLFETPNHKIYSFRHAFEDRMKEANLDDELRRMLMGHTIDRPKYGSGGSLSWKHSQLEKIMLPFDASIV